VGFGISNSGVPASAKATNNPVASANTDRFNPASKIRYPFMANSDLDYDIVFVYPNVRARNAMTQPPFGLALLSAMITPAVLISACGTLIFSTSNRLSRIVDRVRVLGDLIGQLYTKEEIDFKQERRHNLDRQLSYYATRGQLIQRSLSSIYAALAIFVGTTISIGIVALAPVVSWLPTALGIAGTLILFYACVLLIAEARLALKSVNEEMQFALKLSELHRKKERP
jgi:hypothetical protein